MISISTYRMNDKSQVEFPCEWEGSYQWHTFSEWSDISGVNRNTIKTRFYSGKTDRQCLGLDYIPPGCNPKGRFRRCVNDTKPKSCISDREPGTHNNTMQMWACRL